MFENEMKTVRHLKERIRRGKRPLIVAIIEEKCEVEGTYWVVRWLPSLPIFVDGETLQEARSEAVRKLETLFGKANICLRIKVIRSLLAPFFGYLEDDPRSN
ncbi:MAG: hypothetical protein D6732_01320 [Methanobacteriota archaeon]|nr:MAG: hypothetical protein D6732_01320 [Euryarchaeota archaeon]